MKFINQLMVRAIQDNEVGELKKLLDGDIPPNEQDENGLTPLHWAAQEGHYVATRLILQKEPPLDVQDNKGRTPLHIAAEKKEHEIARALLEAGADVRVRDHNGYTAEETARLVCDQKLAGLIAAHDPKEFVTLHKKIKVSAPLKLKLPKP